MNKKNDKPIEIEKSIEIVRICTNLKCLSKTNDPDLACCPQCGQELQELKYEVQKMSRHRN